MNVVIKKLKELATEDIMGVPVLNAELFAELIVQECAEIARQQNLEKAERSYMIHEAIKEHFGVNK